MKIKKPAVSIILFIAFVLTNIPTFATVNIEEPIIRETKKDNRNIKSVHVNDLPQITLDKQKSVPLNEKLSKDDSVAFSNKQAVTETPHINFNASPTIIIPSKITEPSGEWISSNETDEEDIQETVLRNIDNNDDEGDSFQYNKADNINIRSGQGVSFDSLYRISNINSKDSLALQNQTGRTNYIGDNIGDEYVDPMTGFISKKTKGATVLKSQELPGLWNGAMADWITLFVEVPVATFNPVKTVNDLLRKEHREG